MSSDYGQKLFREDTNFYKSIPQKIQDLILTVPNIVLTLAVRAVAMFVL